MDIAPIISAVIPYLVNFLVSKLINYAGNAIVKGLQFVYNPVSKLPDPPNMSDIMPALDVFTDLSSCLRVLLPIDIISKLLFFTLSFYALRIVLSGISTVYHSGFVKRIFGFLTGIFGGFLSGGSDEGGSDNNDIQ